MKPYYQDKWVTIYHGDCREILPQLDVKVDLVLTDPPYNALNIGPNERTYENHEQLSDEEYAAFCRSWFGLVIAKTGRIVFTPGIKYAWNYPQPLWVLCWHKPSAVSYNRMRGLNAWEPVLLYGQPPEKWHGQDYFRQDPLNFATGCEKQHPCPKPMTLWCWLVANASVQGEVILDPFLGSGTTCFCAKKLNRYSIGIEIEEKYCEIAARRCCQEVMELT